MVSISSPSSQSSELSEESVIHPLHRYIHVLPNSLFTVLQACQHQPNKEQNSYWIDIHQQHVTSASASSPSARLLIEQIVHHLYQRVFSSLVSGSSIVGIEWWLHRRAVDAGMFLHFDRDESRWYQQHQAVFPLLSSVLFITDAGGPTLLVQQSTDEQMTQMIPEKVDQQCYGDSMRVLSVLLLY